MSTKRQCKPPPASESHMTSDTSLKPPRRHYSKVSSLPKGKAQGGITAGCIVLEGGAFRSVYEEGVLDALMEAGVNFECTVGVSGGAMNGYNYVAGQIGRAARLNLTYRHDIRYAGPAALKGNAGIMGFDFAFETFDREEPLDKAAFFDEHRRFIAVATNCTTGHPEFFEKGKVGDIFQAIRASASMPFVSRPVIVDGKPCLDGGCSVKVPFQWAIDQGYNKVVVVRTRHKSHRRKLRPLFGPVTRLYYRRYPLLASSLATGNQRSNDDCCQMERLEQAGRIFVIAPSRAVNNGRLEGNMEVLGGLYYLGYNDTKRLLPQLKHYLES